MGNTTESTAKDTNVSKRTLRQSVSTTSTDWSELLGEVARKGTNVISAAADALSSTAGALANGIGIASDQLYETRAALQKEAASSVIERKEEILERLGGEKLARQLRHRALKDSDPEAYEMLQANIAEFRALMDGFQPTCKRY